MLRSIMVAVVVSGGCLWGAGVLADGTDHGDHAPGKTKMPEMKHGEKHQGGKHQHAAIEIAKDQPVPIVKLLVTPDSMAGWNMQLQLENFTFTPERVNTESKTTEGHAHLFLNGRKIARLYGTWYHIPSLPKGKNELRVTLNTNKHEDLTYKGKGIEASAMIEVP